MYTVRCRCMIFRNTDTVRDKKWEPIFMKINYFILHVRINYIRLNIKLLLPTFVIVKPAANVYYLPSIFNN